MSATSIDLRDRPALDLTARKSFRATRNRLASVFMALSFVAVVIPLAFVIGAVIAKGGKVISWDFLTKDIPTQARSKGPGMGPAVYGTLLTTGAATLMAVPLGVLGAIYLNEYGGKGRFAGAVRFLSTVMTGVPSIVMGLFIYTVWVLHFRQSAFAGALALGCLMLPIVIRATEEMLRLVPNYLREASLALGSSKSRTIVTVVLPAALPGIVSGVLLAVARAAGETAPLLFTVGITNSINVSLFHNTNTALSTQIFTNAQQPFQSAVDRGLGAALTLVAIAFLFTVVARLFTARLARKR